MVELGFPAGEGVSAGSWDGTVRASEDAPYVPAGLSLWELSVEKSAGAKAEADYSKRLSTPDGSSTADAVYVAVSLRPWLKRGEWAHEKSGTGPWKEVCALGVDDVETWLESAPITHSWLSEGAGLKPHGLITAETWWNRWSGATTPPFPSAAVVAGRDEEVAALRDALSTPGLLLTVRASSRDEVAAFVASVAFSEEAIDGGALLAQTALVDDVEAWRRLRNHPTPLVLVALTEAVAEEFADGSPHVLVVPLTGTTEADIELSPIDSLAAAQVLKDVELPARKADDAGRLARLSLLAARRRLANKRELHRPAWGESPASKCVRRILLVGRWHENFDGDRGLLEEVTGIPYASLGEEVAALAAGGDPFLARVGGSVGVVSHLDALLVLRGELRKDDLEALHESVRVVLTEVDPRLELPREDRWRASLLGKQRIYSGDLRQGLATTLALLGAHGDRPIDGAGMTSREWGGWMVKEILERANGDDSCLLWASLSDVLPLLAEAAPSPFLEAVRVGATGASPVLRGIFGDAEGGEFFSTDSAHSSLLWAMEVCSWSPEHFGLAVDLLARLAEIDPGGRLANRPFATLEAILLPWFPQNSVSPDRRLSAIDGLREHHETLAWRLLLSLLPEMHGVSGHISEPQFRDWKPTEIAVSHQEYWSFIDELYKRILEDVEHDPDRWVVLIDKIDDVPPGSRAATLSRLDEIGDGALLTEDQRTAIWEALREKIGRHREYADAKWALLEPEVAAIERTAANYEPPTPLARFGWLFKNQLPEIPDVARGDNYREYEEGLARLRAEASAEISEANTWDEISTFAMTLDAPWFMGEALAQAQRFEHEATLLDLVGSENNAEVGFASGYAWKRFRDVGWEWLDPYLAGGDLAPIQLARLLLQTRDFPRAWEVAEAQGDAVENAFWSNFRSHGLGGDFAYVNLAAERLLGVDRPGVALDLIALYSRTEEDQKLEPERATLVVRGLEAILKHSEAAAEVRAFSHYELMGLFEALEGSDLPRERVATLEWAYLPAFGFDSSPVALNEMLSRDTDLFVDLIRRIYRPRRDEEGEDAAELEDETGDEEQRVAFATQAHRLLSDWKIVPGLREDGSIDSETLKGWVRDVRRKLEESGHLEVGDSHIGRVLAHGPADADGARPCEPVRELLEALQSPEIEDGLRIEIYNSRGVTSRDAFDGGDQERVVAAGYVEQSETFADRWPRTASILRDLAQTYEREARRMDEEAERRREGFGP